MVAEQIRNDGVDILVDLSLHSADNRLLAFARQSAPVQVSYGGYPGSTGWSTIEYRISDRWLEPETAKMKIGGEEHGPHGKKFKIPIHNSARTSASF